MSVICETVFFIISHYSLVIWFCFHPSLLFLVLFLHLRKGLSLHILFCFFSLRCLFFFFTQILIFPQILFWYFFFLNLSPRWPSDSLWWPQWHRVVIFNQFLVFISPKLQNHLSILPVDSPTSMFWRHLVYCMSSICFIVYVSTLLFLLSTQMSQVFKTPVADHADPLGVTLPHFPLLSKFPV